MKVLAIIPDSISNPTGGLGIQFKNLYSNLKDKIDFYISGYPTDTPPQNYIGVSHPIPTIRHGSINTLLGHSVYLAESLKHPKPDIVHSYDWSTYLSGVYLAKHYKVPLLLTIQLSAKGLETVGIYNCLDPKNADGAWLHYTHTEIENYGLSESDKIICVSQSYTKYFNEEINKKIEVIPNGISLDKWKPTGKIKLPGKNKYKVVYIGRMALMKSVDLILQSNIPEDIDLIFVGSENGGDFGCLDLLSKTLDIKDNIFYYGSAYDQEKVNLLHSADAIIMPSRHEPFGIVALEAFASECILLSSRVDGLNDFCNDSNSILCTPSKEGIELALYKLKNLSTDKKNKMIQQGLKTCENYKWDKISNQYLEVYKSLLKK